MKKYIFYAIMVLILLALVYGIIQVSFTNALNVAVKEIDKKNELRLNSYSENKDSAKGNTTANNNSGTIMTLDEAKKIAEADAGITNPVYKKEKTDYDDGRQIYELEFIYDNKEYSYEIDAESSKIVEKEIDYNKDNYSNTDSQYNITSEKAEDIALKDAGISIADVKYINSHIERDDGIYVYEVEFAVDTAKYDYEIDAESGAIRSSDIDRF